RFASYRREAVLEQLQTLNTLATLFPMNRAILSVLSFGSAFTTTKPRLYKHWPKKGKITIRLARLSVGLLSATLLTARSVIVCYAQTDGGLQAFVHARF